MVQLTPDVFGAAIRKKRERLALSQEAFAHHCGLHRTYIGSIERGERNVTLTTLTILASAFDCSASELLRYVEGGAT